MSGPRKYKESPATKRADAFVLREKLEKSDRDKFTNPATIETKAPPANPEDVKQKHLSSWIKKKMDDDDVAMREVLAQELFRVVTPYQPKTRLAYDQLQAYDQYYVLSKRVPGFTRLSELNLDEVNKRIISGEFTGLGNMLVMSLFMNETDLKLGNICIDELGRIIKYDGDWCFAKLRVSGENYDITPEVIKRLPYNTTYEAFNWLDLVSKKRKNDEPRLIDISMMRLPALRREINQTILQILLLPETLFRRMIQYYTADIMVTESLFKFLMQRREQLKSAAMQDPSFKEYLKSREADTAMEAFLQELSEFTMTGKTKLLPTEDNVIINDYVDNFNNLRDQLHQTVKAEKASKATTVSIFTTMAHHSPDEATPLKQYLAILANIVTANAFWGKSTGGNIIPGGIDALARLLKGKMLDKMRKNELESLVNKCNDTARRCIKKGPYKDAQTLYKLLADKRSDITTKLTALNEFLENITKQVDIVHYRKR